MIITYTVRAKKPCSDEAAQMSCGLLPIPTSINLWELVKLEVEITFLSNVTLSQALYINTWLQTRYEMDGYSDVIVSMPTSIFKELKRKGG